LAHCCCILEGLILKRGLGNVIDELFSFRISNLLFGGKRMAHRTKFLSLFSREPTYLMREQVRSYYE